MKILVRIYRVKPLLKVHLHFSNITTAALVSEWKDPNSLPPLLS